MTDMVPPPAEPSGYVGMTVDVLYPIDEAFHRVVDGAHQIPGAEITHQDPAARRLVVRTRTETTGGDVVLAVLVEKTPGHTRIALESRPQVPATVADWGKSKQDFEALLSFFPTRAAPLSIPNPDPYPPRWPEPPAKKNRQVVTGVVVFAVVGVLLGLLLMAHSGHTPTVQDYPLGRYPASEETVFLNGCEVKGTVLRCTCALNWMESHESYAQAVTDLTYSGRTGTFPPVIQDAINNCRNL